MWTSRIDCFGPLNLVPAGLSGLSVSRPPSHFSVSLSLSLSVRLCPLLLFRPSRPVSPPFSHVISSSPVCPQVISAPVLSSPFLVSLSPFLFFIKLIRTWIFSSRQTPHTQHYIHNKWTHIHTHTYAPTPRRTQAPGTWLLATVFLASPKVLAQAPPAGPGPI